MLKEKIKEWWDYHRDDICAIAIGAGIGLVATVVAGAGYTAGYKAACEKTSIGYALVCARNPEIKVLADKAAVEVNEMFGK